MASKTLQKTLGDYVTIAMSPALIMALVGSLVFFLLEVLYVGQYSGRLQWTMFFFVFGAVLIARIAIEQPDGTAGLYALALGCVVFLAMMSFVEYPPGGPLANFDWAINLGLMGLVWWCAHRLTYDCTLIDDSVDASGKGVLDAAGLEEQPVEANGSEETSDRNEQDDGSKNPSPRAGVMGWIDRYRNYRDTEAKKPHTPGVWVVYFSLAALPLFGLGQSLIPAEDADRRRYVFWLMVVYVGSGMGLLATTCYLGLRRYLRQRKLKMPVAMTSIWLLFGGGLIVAMLLAGALLPRPYGEYQIVSFTPLGSKDRDGSKTSVLRDSPGKKNGKASNDPNADDPEAKEESGAKSADKAKGTKAGKKGAGKGKSEKGEQKDKSDKSGNEKGSGGKSPPPPLQFFEKLGFLGTLLKWLVFAILALAALFFIFRSGLRWLANFTAWARNLLNSLAAWWNGLFGAAASTSESESPEETKAPLRPFSAFSNPFRSGLAGRASAEQVVRYTFRAFEAWAYEHDLARVPHDTPLEFMHQVGEAVPDLAEPGRRLLLLFLHVTYARGRLTPASLKTVEDFWNHLEGAVPLASTASADETRETSM